MPSDCRGAGRYGRLREEVHREITAARADGVLLTIVLDRDYLLNLQTIFNLPPFPFYIGELGHLAGPKISCTDCR